MDLTYFEKINDTFFIKYFISEIKGNIRESLPRFLFQFLKPPIQIRRFIMIPPYHVMRSKHNIPCPFIISDLKHIQGHFHIS